MNAIRNPKPHKFDFADVCNLESVFRYKGTALLVFLSGLLVTFAFLTIRERNYDSNAKVFVRVGRESVTVDPTATATGQMLQLSDSQKRAIQSSIDIIESEQMMQMLVEYVGTQRILGIKDADREERFTALTPLKHLVTRAKMQLASLNILEPKNDRSTAVASLKKRISVKSEADSNVMSIRVRTEEPELSQLLATRLLENFREAHLKAYRSAGAFPFFTTQLDLTRQEIEQCSKRLSDVKNESGVTSIHDKRSILSEKLKAIELALITARGEYEASLAKADELERAIDSIPEKLVSAEVVGLTNTFKDDMRSKLYSLELELADLNSRYSNDHPLVSKKKVQVEDALKVLGTESVAPQQTTSNNPAREAFIVQQQLSRADVASARARINELDNQHQSLLSEIKNLNESESEIDALERELAVLTVKHQKYSESLEQSRVDDALQDERLSSVNVIQEPTFEEAPVDVSNTIISAGGLFMSLLAAIGSTFALRYLKDEMLTPEDVERELQIPVLATIPRGKDRNLQ